MALTNNTSTPPVLPKKKGFLSGLVNKFNTTFKGSPIPSNQGIKITQQPNMSTPQGPVFAPPPQANTQPQQFATQATPQVKTQPNQAIPTILTQQKQTPIKATPQPITGNVATPSGAIVNQQGGLITPPPQTAEPQQTSGEGTAPVAPQVPPETQQAVLNAEKAFIEAQKISPEQLSTQEDLDRLIESFKKGSQGIKDQPIPLDFITGQLRSLENRALNLAEPLQTKLARLQVKRQNAIATSKFALDRADKRADIARSQSSLALDRAESNRRFEVEQKRQLRAEEFAKQKFDEDVRQFGESQALRKLQIQATQNASLNNLLSKELEKQDKKQLAQRRSVKQADNAIVAVDEALNILDKGIIGSITSPIVSTSLGRATLGRFLPGEAADLRGALSTIKSLIGFGALEEMRLASPTGGALGQVSERELSFLQSTIASLNPAQNDDVLINKLNRIKDSFETLKLINSPDGTVFEIDGVAYMKQGDELIKQ